LIFGTYMDISTVATNIKRIRQNKGFTLDILASKIGATKGYLSQLENFRTLSSLPLLYKIAEALGVDVATLFDTDKERKKFIFTKNGKGIIIEREYPESGFIYKSLAKDKNSKLMAPFLLEIPPHSTRKNVTTNGDEFIYLLKGKIKFILGDKVFEMNKGDSLYFEGNVSHHPENKTNKKAFLLVVYVLRR